MVGSFFSFTFKQPDGARELRMFSFAPLDPSQKKKMGVKLVLFELEGNFSPLLRVCFYFFLFFYVCVYVRLSLSLCVFIFRANFFDLEMWWELVAHLIGFQKKKKNTRKSWLGFQGEIFFPFQIIGEGRIIFSRILLFLLYHFFKINLIIALISVLCKFFFVSIPVYIYICIYRL